MSTPVDLAPALAPITLGRVALRNRVFVAPHTTNFGAAGDNRLTERHVDYHRARARGGAGLIITEGIRVHPTSLRRLGVHAFDDEALPGLTALAEGVHAEGAALFGQLLHTGRHSGDEHQGRWGATATPWTTGGDVPHVMNAFDLDLVVRCFADAAERLVAAGFDGMEVHLGHGHLLQQFLSPITNTRIDGYGGSPRARLRLAAEVLAAVVERVDGRAAIGLRLSADEFLPGGLGPDDVVQAVSWLLEDAPLDFLHVSHSAYIGAPSLSTQMADMSWERAPYRHLPRRFKQEFPDIPVLAICRIDTLATGAEMIAAGDADLVGFARAHIAEPALTRLSLTPTGRPRSCIACNQGCNANLEAITPITCTVNPAVGHERAWADAEDAPVAPRSVLVVGAGPAGLEAAATAARRGHRVELVDAAPAVGGALTDLTLMDGRDGFATLRDELEAELRATPATLRLGTRIDAAAVLASGADVLVLATGATVDPGTALDLGAGIATIDSATAMRDPERIGAGCVIVDDLGSWEASGLALHLAARGTAVDLISGGAAHAARVTIYSRLALAERLTRAGVRVHTLRTVVATDDGVALVPTMNGDDIALPGVRTVVHVRPRRAESALLDDLAAAAGWAGEVHLVGDAFAPRTAQEAIYEGRAVGLSLGVADPAVTKGLAVRPPYLLPAGTAVPGAVA